MSNAPKPGAVLFAKNLPLLARFYEGAAGFVTTYSDAGVIVLESSSQQLVLHGIPERIAETIKIDTPPKRREGVAVKLILPVASIAETRNRSLTLGGELNPPKQEFEARGFRACDGHDPEGNIIQFREPCSDL